MIILNRWPAAVGLATAAFQLATSADRDGVGTTLGVAVVCYLAAAALGRPWVAWAAIVPAGVVVVACELAGVAWWAGLGVFALALAVAGALGPASRPALPAQTAALIGYGGLVVAALSFAPRAGLAVAGVVLAAHAVWDLIHYVRNQVVPRSLAEFCMLLDVPLGVGAIILAIVD